VRPDNYNLQRPKKIASFFKDHEELYPYLRVCWRQFKSLNCSQCEKCLRTICDLLVNNIDPALCNFHIDSATLPALRRKISKRYYFFFRDEGTLEFWRAIQDNIDLNDLKDMYGSKEFFTWLSNFSKMNEKQSKVIASAVSAYLNFRCALGKAKENIVSSFELG
jgi:hypothetical protein